MSVIVTITTNPIDLSSYQTFETDNLNEFLFQFFDGVWPDSARLYHQQVSQDHDITPSCEEAVDRIQELQGPFFVVVYPEGPLLVLVIMVTVAIAMVVLMPSPAIPSLGNRKDQSANNELSNRTNQARPLKRIPDIFGTVRSTPDLIALPYKLFINHEEVEYAYMCIGRGEYDVSDIRDGDTLISEIAGAAVAVYAPFTSPNSGDAPQLQIGDAINEPIIQVKRSNSVNGQVLRSPNTMKYIGDSDVRFKTPNIIELHPDSDADFTGLFQADDPLNISTAAQYTSSISEVRSAKFYSGGYFEFELPSETLPSQYDVGKDITLAGALVRYVLWDGTIMGGSIVYGYRDLSGVYEIADVELVTVSPDYFCRITLVDPELLNPQWDYLLSEEAEEVSVTIDCPDGTLLFDLDGDYTILSVSVDTILLSNPSAVNADWGTITTTEYMSPTLNVTGDRWIGPFKLDTTNLVQVYSNFVAPNGLYKDNGKNQRRVDVVVELELTPIDNAGYATGAAETFQGTIQGTSEFRSQRAITMKVTPTFTGQCEARARRVTLTDLDYRGTVVDEIKWRDLYSVVPVTQTEFGNVTTVQSLTYATAGAMLVKDRKLNTLVTRRVPILSSDGTLSGSLQGSNSIADILPAVCVDEYIGNRDISEVDVDNIYDTVAEIIEYFGTEKAVEFNHTFDDANMSFEETVFAISQAAFCQAYRFGNLIKLLFEKETEDSSILFNHRNKIPNTETRTVTFGNINDYDGVELEYVDDEDDAVITFYVPEDKSALNPKKVKMVGIRNKVQARFHAYRMYNKILYQNIAVEFQSTQEAALLIRSERILVADNTRPDTQDGQVESQSVLTLTLSQPVDLTQYGSYNIFLQLIDGTVESIPITAGATSKQVVLGRAPRLSLSVDDDNYAKCAYTIVGATEDRQNAFLVVEKSPQNNMTYQLQAINYDSRYYQNDLDYIYGIVEEDGDVV